MIADQHLLHGAAMLALVEGFEQVTISHENLLHDSLYRVSVNGTESFVLFKISTKRLPSWHFVLTSDEVTAVQSCLEKHASARAFLALVCYRDGVCCVPYEVARKLVEGGPDPDTGHIGVSRPHGGSYRLSGDGRIKHDRVIPKKDWPLALDGKVAFV